MRAYILITTKPGTSEEVVKAIKEAREVQGVVLADSVYGRFDAIVVIEASDLDEVSRLVYQVIEKIPNVVHTETALTVF
jgi:DNA-binding Lrp family transcriptional regulator